MNSEEIAKKVSEILKVKYSHHDLHFADYGFNKKHSLLTSYQGMSPYTFSILEDGTIWTLMKPLLHISKIISDNLGDEAPETIITEKQKVIDELGLLETAEVWIKENDVVNILKNSLSDFYKELMTEYYEQTNVDNGGRDLV